MSKFQKLSKRRLIKTCSEICYFAQSHSADQDAWGYMIESMMHVSFVVSCLICHNTKHGSNGVDSDLVIKELVGPVLSLKDWKKIIKNLVKDYGGSKFKQKLIEVKNA